MRHSATALTLAAALLLAACSAGVRPLGTAKLEDGSTMHYVQVKTSGISGPDITVIEGFVTRPGEQSEKITSYSGTAPGAAEIIAGGLSNTLPLAGGMVGAATVLRPARTNISQGQEQHETANGGQGGKGGNAKAIGKGGAGGNASSSATGGNATAHGGNAVSNSSSRSDSNATGGQAVMRDFSVNANASIKDFSVGGRGGIDPAASQKYH